MKNLLVACGALARELIALRDRHAWDAQILAIPAQLHNRPHLIPDAVSERVAELDQSYEKVIVVYGDCGTGGMLDVRLEELGLERISGPHCYEQYAGAKEFDGMMDEQPGTFFLTDYMVQSYDHIIIEGLGLDRFPELRDMYFGNYTRLLYLQQREDPALLSKAQELAEYLSLPLETTFTGYGELESRLLEML